MDAEKLRLAEAQRHDADWRHWGPYLAEREWGTVREDYSPDGEAWDYFPFEHSHLRTYRWGEDGIAGICDRHQRLCFALAFWNGRDPILKERLFGLNGEQGNHGEDVKEIYYYLDSTPTHSYMKCLYKYPQQEFPYQQLRDVNGSRTKQEPEFELLDTGVFAEDRYFDIFTEYAKADPDDVLIRISVANRGPATATLHLLPTLWFRNTWAWASGSPKPSMRRAEGGAIDVEEAMLGSYRFTLDGRPPLLFTENESNEQALWKVKNPQPYVKDALGRYIVHGEESAVNPGQIGTKACAWYRLDLAPGETRILRLRLTRRTEPTRMIQDLDGVFAERILEADEFYACASGTLSPDACAVQRQAYAGLLWSKQSYHFIVETWLRGDPGQPAPPASRLTGRNSSWVHLYNADVLSMPDKWEYPWYAAWDLAFHTITLSTVDPDSAKAQLSVFLREWYLHPNGQVPAYEWQLGDVNPPVHAWACWRVFQIDRKQNGRADYAFLESAFHKLLLNFTWWVNRKDESGNNIFEGGFLGLDNVGVFNRSDPAPGGGYIEQSDGTSWMAMYCLSMLAIALELASNVNIIYEDIASKFLTHFLYIANAMNGLVSAGLWDDADGFFYDRLRLPSGGVVPLRVRSVVGLMPLFAVETIESEVIDRLPGFRQRMDWYLTNRPDLCRNIFSLTREGVESRRLLSLMDRPRMTRVLARLLDEKEFLSPHGVRSISKYHQDHPFVLNLAGQEYRVDYEPAESTTALFGGNSNWRGPVWFPVNYLVIESLQRYGYYFGEDFLMEFPTGSGKRINLGDVAAEISRRLSRIFLRDEQGRRPVFGGIDKFQNDPHFRDYVWFHEYFHGDNGAGLGASHQTGWTALVAKLLQQSGD
jgi:Mannosylglycerate hydrolase MGH1-like glycoside hydrolase domain